MALWNGTDLNKTALASMFNQMWTKDGAISIVRKANGLLYAIMDKSWEPAPPREGYSIKRMTKVSGNQIEVRLRGKNEALATVADGAQELATAPTLYSDNTFGGAKFDLTHYANRYGVPDSEYDRIVGSEAKTKSFAADRMMAVTEDHENEWGNQINGAQVGFTRTQMGSWIHAVSDGVTTGEAAYKTYGLIDRSDPANADFRGLVNYKNGVLTLADIVTTRNLTRKNGGKTDILLAETTVYSQLETKLMNTQVVVTYDDKWSQFGGQFWRFAGMVGIMEHRMPTGVLGGLDTSTWAFWMDDKKPFSGDRTLIVDPSIAAGRVILPRFWTQLLCNKPNSNFKITGITGVA